MVRPNGEGLLNCSVNSLFFYISYSEIHLQIYHKLLLVLIMMLTWFCCLKPCCFLCLRSLQIFSTNNTECAHLLDEIKCARCSPNAQVLFHSLDIDRQPHREPDLPRLCLDFCRKFYYTCRGHIPGKHTYNTDHNCN